MSWSFSVKATSPDDFLAALGAAEATGNSEASAERDEQVIAAKAAITLLFDSPALGNAQQPGSRIGAIVSGHAQPAHAITGKPEDFQSENVVINLWRIVEDVPVQSPVVEQPVATPDPVAAAPEPEPEPAAASSTPVVTGGLAPLPPVGGESSSDDSSGGDVADQPTEPTPVQAPAADPAETSPEEPAATVAEPVAES